MQASIRFEYGFRIDGNGDFITDDDPLLDNMLPPAQGILFVVLRVISWIVLICRAEQNDPRNHTKQHE